MHLTQVALVAVLAAASSTSARAILYRPEPRAPAATAVLQRRQDGRASPSSTVSAVTTMPLPSSAAAPTTYGIWSTANPLPFSYGRADPSYPGIVARGSNGPTNPDEPQLNTTVNQTSVSRLASINSVDDWCTFGPEALNNTEPLGNIEQTTVAYCTKPRNNARVIPDGTVTSVQFVKTPLYVQLYARGDFTNINMALNDSGGELDPHGEFNTGNPIGGNVTSNVKDGQTDVFYQEWMNYLSSEEVCFRVCIAGSDQATPAIECQHQLDVMGCQFVMAQLPVQDGIFESCESDSAYPPGLYPQPDGSTSTFQQYYAGVYTVGETAYSYQNAHEDQITPSSAYSYPTPSSCTQMSTISNGLVGLDYRDPAALASSTAGSSADPTSAKDDTADAKSTAASGPDAAPTGGADAVASSSVIAASGQPQSSGATRTLFTSTVAFIAALGAGVALL